MEAQGDWTSNTVHGIHVGATPGETRTMVSDQDTATRLDRISQRVADDLARVRILLLDAEDALAAAFTHIRASRATAIDDLHRDLNAVRSIRADLDSIRPPGSALGLISEGAPALNALTPRERNVALLLARGLTDRQIAQRLVISPATVGVHVEHIFGKLGLHSRAQLAAWMAGLESGPSSGRP